MADINELRPKILAFEGGFQDSPDDKANYTSDGTLVGTNCGVSAATYEQIFGQKPSVEDIKNLTDEQFNAVLEHFGAAIHYDDISNQSIADIFFDWCWASGTYYPTKHVQNILGIGVDGICGEGTVAAINGYDPQSELFDKIKNARMDYIDSLVAYTPSDAQFEEGWKSRVNAYTFA
jgi:lysozyme family protein